MATEIYRTIFQLKRGTAGRWKELNPILEAGEPGYELDTGKLKIGNGVDSWINLQYSNTQIYNFSNRNAFPSSGDCNCIYKAEEEKKLYQWNDRDCCYEPITSGTETIYVENIVDFEESVREIINDSIINITSDIDSLRNNLREISIDVSDNTKDISNISQELVNIDTDILEIESNIKDVNDNIKDIEEHIDVLDTDIDDMSSDITAIKDILTTIQNDISNIDTSSNVLQLLYSDIETMEGDTEVDKILSYLDNYYPNVQFKTGDSVILKKLIIDDKYSYTGYVFQNNSLIAMDGNYNAENIILNEDLTFTADIGVKKVPSTGSGTISAKGKSLEEVLKSILAERKNPSKTDPTASLTSNNIGSKEVGTNISINYSFTTTKGSYTYDSDTGVTFSNPSATFNGETKTGLSGKFSSIQVKDDTNLKIIGSIEQSDGIIPHDNLGDEYEDSQIESKLWTGLEKGTLTGYRAWFCGYKNGDNAIKDPTTGAANATLITGDQIRSLGNSANGSWKSSLTVTGMQQMFFAAPKGKGYKPAVKDASTTAPQTVNGPFSVYVKGANNYTAPGDETNNGGMEYDVWYVNNTNAASGSATLNITRA